MRILLVVSLCLLPMLALAQGAEQTLVIDNLKGLNTRSGVFALQPNELVFAHNIDYGDIGAYKKRKGYDSATYIAGMDSIVDNGIFAAFYNDGTQQLVVVCDSTGVGYGGVYLTPLGSINLEDSATKIYDYFSVQNKPDFVQYLDRIYISNGSHRPIVYDKNSGLTRQVNPRVPGEPLLVPLNVSGNLNGEYVYNFSISPAPRMNAFLDFGGDDYEADGSITGKIKVLNGQVMLRDFPRPSTGSYIDPWKKKYGYRIVALYQTNKYTIIINNDTADYITDITPTRAEIAQNLRDEVNSCCGDTVDARAWYESGIDEWFVYIRGEEPYMDYTCSTADSVQQAYVIGDSIFNLNITRTASNPGEIDVNDSSFSVGSIEFDFDDTLAFDTYSFIDNYSDDTYDGPLYTDKLIGLDTLYNIGKRYGAPGWLSIGDSVSDTSAYGVYGGTPLNQLSVLGMAYACTFVDTITGLESDTGRICVIWKDTSRIGDSIYTHTISLPRVSANDTGFKINLYRATLFSASNDTGWRYDSVWHVFTVWAPGGGIDIVSLDHVDKWVNTISIDTVYPGTFNLLRQFDDTVTQYTDSVRIDSLMIGGVAIRKEYRRSGSPPLMRGMFAFQDRMFAFQGNKLYYSGLDAELLGTSIHDWADWDYIIVGEGDGDEIVLAHPARDYIRVFKHNSSWIVYQGDDGFELRTEYNGIWPHVDYVGAYGCLSRWSFAQAPEGSYYLSNMGVLVENDGQYLNRRRETRLASSTLDNFDGLSVDAKEDAFSIYIPHEQKYLLSIGDTTYYYDMRADAWSTWSVDISAGALYRVEDGVNNYPGDTLYFSKPGGSIIYRYGEYNTDDGTLIPMSFKFAPILTDNKRYSITAIGLWSNSEDSVAGLGEFYAGIYNEEDSLLSLTAIPALRDNRYIVKSVDQISTALYYSIWYQNVVGQTDYPTVFDKFEVFYIDQGVKERE